MRITGVRRAIIDVGTNSVKLLVAEISGTTVAPLHEESHQTRLGAGFYQTGRLSASAIEQTAQAIAQFAQRAAEFGAESPRLIATSAARDAVNVDELKAAVRRSCGLEMRVLSGAEEADWVFRGVTTDPKLSRHSLLILDIGGGSTEFIVGEDSVAHFSESYPMGSVRLLERLHLIDPPGLARLAECRAQLRDFLEEHVSKMVEPAIRRCAPGVHLICTGGTATILARMNAGMSDFDRERIESVILTFTWLDLAVKSLWGQTLAERRTIPGLPPNRADVILTGAAIAEAIMSRFGFSQMRASARGLRYWGLLETGLQNKKGRAPLQRPPSQQPN